MAFKAAFLACVVSLFSALAGFGQTLEAEIGELKHTFETAATYDAALAEFLQPGAVVHTWMPSAPGCNAEWSGGVSVFCMRTEKVSVAVGILQVSGKEIDLMVGVYNNSSHTIDVLPEQAAIQHLGAKGKILRAKAPEEVVAALRRRAAITAIFVEVVPLFQRTYSEARGYVGPDQVRLEVESPDELARARGAAAADRILADAEVQAEEVQARALMANTLHPGESVTGILTFRREKNAEYYRVALVLDGEIFSFLFRRRK